MRLDAEHYTFGVIYENGDGLLEDVPCEHYVDTFGPRDRHVFACIEIDKVVEIFLLPFHSDRIRISVSIDLSRGQRPIFFRRRSSVVFGPDTGESFTVTCIGLQETVEGKNVAFYNFVDPDGNIVSSTDLNKVTYNLPTKTGG
jgi:hypothetical protein